MLHTSERAPEHCAKKKAGQVEEKLRAMHLAEPAEIVESSIDETLSYYAIGALAQPDETLRCHRSTSRKCLTRLGPSDNAGFGNWTVGPEKGFNRYLDP